MSDAPRIAGLVLAAGAGTRFGAAKQLAPLGGRPLLEHALAAMAAAARVERSAVALGAHAEEILAAVDLHGTEPLRVADWSSGLSASLRAGVAALGPSADAIVVTLGDQPHVGAELIDRVVAAWTDDLDAVRATHGGAPGHPVLLARTLYPAIATLSGDEGAGRLLPRARVREIEGGPAAVLDVDRPEKLAGLSRAAREDVQRDT